MTELRRRMDDDMLARGLADRTRSRISGRSPASRSSFIGRRTGSRTRKSKRILCICSATGSGPGARATSCSTGCASSITRR